MCRLFAVIGKEPVGIEGWLIREKNSISQQSKEHKHGWGLGWIEDSNLRLEKSPKPAYKDKTFLALAKILKPKLGVVHIRRSRVGSINIKNNQPFVRGKWFFAHNGTITNYKKLLPLINVKHLSSETDSEAFFQLIMKNLKKLSPEKAVSKAVEAIAKLCRYSSLNCIFSDNAKLYALCEYKKEPSYYRMNYLRADTCIVISSEKIGTDKWEKMNNHKLMAIDKNLSIKKITV